MVFEDVSFCRKAMFIEGFWFRSLNVFCYGDLTGWSEASDGDSGLRLCIILIVFILFAKLVGGGVRIFFLFWGG